MSQIDDGVIKFDQSDFERGNGLSSLEFEELESWRKRLYELRLIGEYLPEKIGYGNISEKKDYQDIRSTHRPQFLISGTQTGGLSELGPNQYTRVVDFEIDKNKVSIHGPIMASSESLTHAALYLVSDSVKCVFHIHDQVIWSGILQNEGPATPASIPYGTTQMAQYVQKMFPSQSHGYFAMAGHQDGVIAFAPDLETAGSMIIDLFNKYHD
jgi:hypothetical protein